MSLLYVDDVIRASSWSGTCSLPGHIEKEVVMGLLWRPLVPVSRWSGACFTTFPSGQKIMNCSLWLHLFEDKV